MELDKDYEQLQKDCSQIALMLDLDLYNLTIYSPPPIDDFENFRRFRWRAQTTDYRMIGGRTVITNAEILHLIDLGAVLRKRILRQVTFDLLKASMAEGEWVNRAQQLYWQYPEARSLWELARRFYWDHFKTWLKWQFRWFSRE